VGGIFSTRKRKKFWARNNIPTVTEKIGEKKRGKRPRKDNGDRAHQKNKYDKGRNKSRQDETNHKAKQKRKEREEKKGGKQCNEAPDETKQTEIGLTRT